jgi:hypothetical protein
MRRRLLGATALAGLFAASLPAAAEAPCGVTSRRPVVELVLEVEPPDRIIGTTLQQHLQAELAAREIDLCAQPIEPRRPITRVSLHVDRPPRGPVVAVIRINDLVTDKLVERTIDLSRLPADSRPLAVAAAVDELLRATWAELTITDAPKPVEAPPPAVVRAVEVSSRPRPPAPSVVEVGVVATASDLFGHRAALGGEAWIGAWFFPRWALQLRFGADAGLPRASPHGTARADAISAGVGLAFSPIDHDARLGVRFEAGASLLRVRLVGDTAGAAIAAEGWQWTGTADGTVRGWARTGPLFWNLGVGAIAALRAVRATDNGATVTSVEGVGGKIAAGLAFHFH